MANWQAFELRGDAAQPRKAAAAATCGARTIICGGVVPGADDAEIATNEVLVLDHGRCWALLGQARAKGGVCLLISGDKALAVPCLTHNLTPPICACPPTTTPVPGTRGAASCTVLTATPDAPGAPWPAPRSGASLCECAPNQLLLCGGVGADGKPAADVWLLDVAELAWRCVYNGSSQQLAASGASAAVPHHAGGLDVATLGSACSRTSTRRPRLTSACARSLPHARARSRRRAADSARQ